MTKRTELDTVYLVATYAECDDNCAGYEGVTVFASEQTAKQFASSLYGGFYLGSSKVHTKKPF